jgi:hypothetical protein
MEQRWVHNHRWRLVAVLLMSLSSSLAEEIPETRMLDQEGLEQSAGKFPPPY